MASPKASCTAPSISNRPELKRSWGSMRSTRLLRDELKQSMMSDDTQLQLGHMNSTIHSQQYCQADACQEPPAYLEHTGFDLESLAHELDYYKELLQSKNAEISELRERLKMKEEELMRREFRVLEMMDQDKIVMLSNQLFEVSEELSGLRAQLPHKRRKDDGELVGEESPLCSSEASFRQATTMVKIEAPYEIIPLQLTTPFEQQADDIRTKRINRAGVANESVSPFGGTEEGEEPRESAKQSRGQDRKVLECQEAKEIVEVGKEGWIYQIDPDRDQESECEWQQRELQQLVKSPPKIVEPIIRILRFQPQAIQLTLASSQPKPAFSIESRVYQTSIPPLQKLSVLTNTKPQPLPQHFTSLLQLTIDSLNNSLRLLLKAQPQNRPTVETIKRQIIELVDNFNSKLKRNTNKEVYSSKALRQVLEDVKKIY